MKHVDVLTLYFLYHFFDVESTPSLIPRSNTLKSLIYLTEWKHVLLYGTRLTSLRWCKGCLGPTSQELTENLQDFIFACWEVPDKIGEVKEEYLTKEGLVAATFVLDFHMREPTGTMRKVVQSTYPMFLTRPGDPLEFVDNAKEYKNRS